MLISVKIGFYDLMVALQGYSDSLRESFEDDCSESLRPAFVIGTLAEDDLKNHQGDYISVDFGSEFCGVHQVPYRACTLFVDTRAT